jgi:hypothetical protein
LEKIVTTLSLMCGIYRGTSPNELEVQVGHLSLLIILLIWRVFPDSEFAVPQKFTKDETE